MEEKWSFGLVYHLRRPPPAEKHDKRGRSSGGVEERVVCRGVWVGNESTAFGRTDQIKRYESSAMAIGGARLRPFTVRWNKRSIEFQTEAV